ncbi:MAG: FMN-binding protein [Lachnospiraceae bacterium]|nr:FMN-binding protein [Lachnospiraceae bacterium]
MPNLENENVVLEEKTVKGPLFDKDGLMEMLKNTLIILAITLVAGGILGCVYEVTKGPIAIMEQKKKDDAHQKVFANASSFAEVSLDKNRVKELLAVDYQGIDINEVFEAYSSNKDLLGYVIEVNSHEGFGGDIIFSIGITLDGVTNGISITSISETAGLGMKAPEVLVPQFANKNVMSFNVTKTGAAMDNEIDAISSATITSNAVVKGVNAALFYYKNELAGGKSNE